MARESRWGDGARVVVLHVRAREEGEDNDDWPTADAPDRGMLEQLRACTESAVLNELGTGATWDLYVASTTEKARLAAVAALRGARGLRRVLSLDGVSLHGRHTRAGNEDAMAEAAIYYVLPRTKTTCAPYTFVALAQPCVSMCI